MLNIGIDLMGSDCSPVELFLAILQALKTYPQVDFFTIYVTSNVLEVLKKTYPQLSKLTKIRFHLVTEVIGMDDKPLSALKKEKSSLVQGMQALRDRQIDAFVSAGNTGALLVSAKKKLTMKKDLFRPFLMIALPLHSRHVVICDVGANIPCRAEHLVQFATVAAEFFSSSYHKSSPRVALLNVGAEEYKGTLDHRLAYQQLAEITERAGERSPFTFCGNIEGRDVFSGKVDVVVTDGFTGNVFLKTMEGTADYLFERIIDSLEDSASISKLKSLQESYHYTEFPGAILAGVEEIVIKCHGAASPSSLFNGIKGAIELF